MQENSKDYKFCIE